MQIDKTWSMVFIKPDGQVLSPAAILPTPSLAKLWLSRNYQGDHRIVPVQISVTVPDSALEEEAPHPTGEAV